MRSRDIRRLGVPSGSAVHLAQEAVTRARRAGLKKRPVEECLRRVVADPEAFVDDPHFGPLAEALVDRAEARAAFEPRDEPAPWRSWGEDLDEKSLEQMRNAAALPVSVRGALMPDAHLGYGLPIGGVLATDNAVIPYAVGVDIACRVKMSILDLPTTALGGQRDRLKKAIERETRFGIGARFRQPRDHAVMDDDWSVSPVTKKVKDKAWTQLGTSGSGNHFVELGELEVMAPGGGDEPASAADHPLGLVPGRYLALLSHSGSRGAGATVANHYSRLARELHPELPKELHHLAWLDLDTEEGQEYWRAMNLMGRYASANHAVIHRELTRALGAEVVVDVENHHNFAWEEEHDGRPLIVHRKGATPAGEGVLGIIPGTMADPAYVVRGRGSEESLRSAAHGAGRRMSRTQAKKTFTWSQANQLLEERGVELLSAGLDEVPMVYKNIDEVMGAQADLVEPVARFFPRLVKMAPAGERPED